MKSHNDNPAANKLGSGITEEKLSAAITKSGYPLQTKVALQLKKATPLKDKWTFHLQEEWSFIDDRTGEIRTIDILAEKWLFGKREPIVVEEPKEPLRVRPMLDLIIECKQSELPFVFFLMDEKPTIRNFPYIAGLSKDDITITTDNDTSTWQLTFQQALSLQDDDFLIKDPIFCNKFCKCERRSGGELLLSGEETFNGIVQPLLKAMRHFKLAEKPPETAMYFDCHLVLGIGVLDAPMVGVEISKYSHEVVLLPWIRVIRHQVDKIPTILHNENVLAIDIIHKDFLDDYINNHVLPFSERVSKLIFKHHQVIATAKGFVSNMNGVHPFEIEKHLQPSRVRSKKRT